MPLGAPVVAVLGPTNTGKTHRAVERMLELGSGMLGFPLRLLAREVYDRVSRRVGEQRVALVTGEEKRVPRSPDFWICTVEAMPLEREVDFLAVDEIQLAAHEQRGHVFTHRLLHARGRVETWFSGSDTILPLLRQLVPAAQITSHPRLSRLSSVGATPLGRLPPRSAVVAFSMPQVYELAERLRALRGGTAVVLGALSPRARNAQVAMFQAGEVDYLVATDAIGMGLNLDVDHVAFASLRKFDGRDARPLDDAELAQIAGRAGRWIRDGTFGTVSPLTLPDDSVRAIETHRFPALRRVRWRNADLDFQSPDALLASLRERAPRPYLALAFDAEDTRALERLLTDGGVRREASSPERLALLWDVCGVPDFRRLLFESHVAFLRELFLELTRPRGVLDPVWLATRIAELDDASGDADTLMARMAAIRTFTYVSGKTRWVEDAHHWQEKTRLIEDRLSDALHQKLVQRFVTERRAGKAPRRSRGSAPAVNVVAPEPSSPFHDQLRALRARLAPAVVTPAPRSVEALVDATHGEFRHDEEGFVYFAEEPVARFAPGPSLALPEVILTDTLLGLGARARLQRRLVAYARDVAGELLAPLRALAGGAGERRGVLYALEQGLGTALPSSLEPALADLSLEDRQALEAGGVVFGRCAVFATALLDEDALATRRLLVRAAAGPRLRLPPSLGEPVLAMTPPARLAVALGYVPVARHGVRVDVLEELVDALQRDAADVRAWSRRLRCSPRIVAELLAALPSPGAAPAADC